VPSGRIQYYTGAKNPEVGYRIGAEVRPEVKNRVAHLKYNPFFGEIYLNTDFQLNFEH